MPRRTGQREPNIGTGPNTGLAQHFARQCAAEPLSEREREGLKKLYPPAFYEISAVEELKVVLYDRRNRREVCVDRYLLFTTGAVERFDRCDTDTQERAVAFGVIAIDVFSGEVV